MVAKCMVAIPVVKYAMAKKKAVDFSIYYDIIAFV